MASFVRYRRSAVYLAEWRVVINWKSSSAHVKCKETRRKNLLVAQETLTHQCLLGPFFVGFPRHLLRAKYRLYSLDSTCKYLIEKKNKYLEKNSHRPQTMRDASFGPFLIGCWCQCWCWCWYRFRSCSCKCNLVDTQKRRKKKHTAKGSRHAGLEPSSPPANLPWCWWLGVVTWPWPCWRVYVHTKYWGLNDGYMVI